MTVIKPNLGRHAGTATNSLTFAHAYATASSMPATHYHTTGDATAFTVEAAIRKTGSHAGQQVLRFMSGTEERACVYECCWNHKTNCACTHIDCYTEAM